MDRLKKALSHAKSQGRKGKYQGFAKKIWLKLHHFRCFLYRHC